MKIFKNFSLRNLFYNKKFSISVSIVAAFIFWLVIVIDQNPEREQTITNIPIEISTVGTVWGGQGLEVVTDVDQKASVSVYGPNYIVSSLRDSDIKIVPDFSDVKGAGTYTVNLSAVRNSNKTGYSIMNISPSSVSVKFDYFDEKTFAVTPVVEGYEKVEGLTYDDEVVTNSEQSNITVRGPRNEMSKIVSVIAYASTNKTLSTTTSFNAEIKLFDEQGAQLDKTKYEISVDNIKISVPVSKTKVLKFAPSYVGAINNSVIKTLNGCWKADVDTFTVAGSPELIDSIDNIEFTPIDLSKLSPKNKTNVFELTPILPSGVRIVDGIDTVTISYDLSGFSVKRIKISNFDDENTLPKGMKASYSNNIYVEVCGKKSVINSLNSDDCYLSVNLSDASIGESLVNAVLKTYKETAVWQIVSCEITVKVK